MTEKRLEDMSNDEIVSENIRVMNQTEKLLKATYVVNILTIIALIILIFVKLLRI